MPQYPINAVYPRLQYTASSMQTVFSYTWPIFTAGDIKVWRTPVGTPANEANNIQILDVDYTVTGVGNEGGGTIVMILPVVAGSIVTLQREMPIARQTNYTNGSAIDADALNADFDRLTMMIQDLNVFIQKIMPRYNVPATIPPPSLVLPQLLQGYYWQGGPNKSLVAVQSEENPDASTLRTELANNATADSAGANLVGYNDSFTGASTVRTKLNELAIAVNTHVLSILSFGAMNDGSTDTTPALNAAYNYCDANNIGTLLFPEGVYLFSTEPDLCPKDLQIQGDGATTTLLQRGYNPAGGQGLFGTVDNAISVNNLEITAMTGTSAGSGISIASSADDIDSGISIFNVNITDDGGGTYDNGIFISGNNAHNISSGKIDNVLIYGCDVSNLTLINVLDFDVNINCSQGSGAVDTIIITGNSSFPSENINLSILTAQNLILDYVQNIIINAVDLTNLTNTAHTGNAVVYGNVTGTKQVNWLTSRYITNQDFKASVTGQGYTKLPNGLIIQWETIIVSTGAAQNFSLPTPFPNTNFGVFSFIQDAAVSSVESLVNNSSANTLSTVNCEHASTASETYRIIAIGN